MATLSAHLIGRFGNQLFQYCHARALSERTGAELRTNIWPGQEIFEGVACGPLSESGDRLGEDYRMRQRDLIYTKRDIRRWLTFKPWVHTTLAHLRDLPVAAHHRLGDYPSCGYPVVDRSSYVGLCSRERLAYPTFISEEEPLSHPNFTGPLAFVPDFYAMVHAQILLRANSSFSWWAAALSCGVVYSPLIEGLRGDAPPHTDVQWCEGNSARLSEHDFVEPLNLPL